MRFLILYSQGPSWREGVILHNQPFMPEHAVYVQQEYNKGNIMLAGPYGDMSGGAVLIDVDNEEQMIHFVDNDPAVKNNIFRYVIKAWGNGMSKFENRSPNYDQGYLDYKHKIQKELNII